MPSSRAQEAGERRAPICESGKTGTGSCLSSTARLAIDRAAGALAGPERRSRPRTAARRPRPRTSAGGFQPVGGALRSEREEARAGGSRRDRLETQRGLAEEGLGQQETGRSVRSRECRPTRRGGKKSSLWDTEIVGTVGGTGPRRCRASAPTTRRDGRQLPPARFAALPGSERGEAGVLALGEGRLDTAAGIVDHLQAGCA